MDQMLQKLPDVLLAAALVVLASAVLRLCDALIWAPERLRSKLRKQGITGPPPSFLLGNLREIRAAKRSTAPANAPYEGHGGGAETVIVHNCSSKLFPFFDRWRKEYGPVFMFSLGNIQLLYVYEPTVVRDIITCTSLELGKPSYQFKEKGSLLGQGILTSNGAVWANQRKILAPELYAEKVKGMINLMVESSSALVKSWSEKIEGEGGGVCDIRVDDYMRSFSGDVISRACFGSSYSKGADIFLKLMTLQEVLYRKVLVAGIPGVRFLPTKSNRKIWRLEREVRSLILKLAEERREAESPSHRDLLQIILDGAQSSHLDHDSMERFVVDNCKNIYLAGYETTAVSATWTLMLLASNPEWQQKVREEVIEVCGGRLPDANMIRKMKTLTMVIHEALRLYPPVPLVSREALTDMKFGQIHVPKGVSLWALTVTLHSDPDIWGPDALQFRPDRFSNGVSGACRLPYVYMPFGVGPRTCLGQNLAMAELKILVSMIVSSFSLSISPKYTHSPALRLVIEPEHGVNLLVKKL